MEIVRDEMRIDNDAFQKVRKRFDELRKKYPKRNAFSMIRDAVQEVCGKQETALCKAFASKLAKYRSSRRAKKKEREDLLRAANKPCWEKEEVPEDPSWPKLDY